MYLLLKEQTNNLRNLLFATSILLYKQEMVNASGNNSVHLTGVTVTRF